MKVILWDIMDTLVVDPFRTAMPAFFGMSLDELIAVKHPTAWVRFELDELDERTFLESFFSDGRAYDAEGFRARVRSAYHWIDGMQELLRSLTERGVSMHALSNYPTWYTWIDERLGLSRYLSFSFISCHTGLRKPEPEAYRFALRQLEVAPSECIFIDDRPQNCEAARALGMHALHFRGDAGALERELAAIE